MPGNVGEMFYTGQMPWHGLGIALSQPATMEEALKVGGLNWRVEDAELATFEDPPSPVLRRKALVRSDKMPGDASRVIGVAHLGFNPIQNHDAGLLFDAIFGHGKRVYHTGGYLGHGEVVWLLAKLDRTLRIRGEDVVEPYALMANSHDGSRAFSIHLTMVRVVCQNTLSVAMKRRIGGVFRRSHKGSLARHSQAALTYFAGTMSELDSLAQSFTHLANRICDDRECREILNALVPDPSRPRSADRNPSVQASWEGRREKARAIREQIFELRQSGKGQGLTSARGTYWGLLNAVLEYVDHHHQTDRARLAYSLLGSGADLKARAFRMVQDAAARAA